MAEVVYNWKRFWCPRDGKLNLGDAGYLVDPDSEFGRYANADVKDYSSLREIPCLALLGEPGIGKSYTIEDIAHAAGGGGPYLIHVNLREFGSEDRLVSKVFESHTYREWLGNDSTLELLLDSLDECLLRIGTVVPILTSRLRDAPVDRLRLRIGCRTAQWPATLEHALVRYWGEKGFAAYELCPLRRQDVQHAVETEGLDPGHFQAEIGRVRVQPLAIKPVTLRFLLKLYRRDECLPVSESELYEQGCRLLCEESQERLDSRVPFAFSTNQRLAVAKRIAAVTVFANKFAIWTTRDEGDVPDEDVLVEHLMGDSEIADGNSFSVSREAITEATNTGLFSSRGLCRMGWVHHTYAEFLASAYLRDRGVSADQMLSLVTDEVVGQVHVIPQLSEVAARIATEVPGVFDALLEHDPVILLRSDVAIADATRRERLVDALLGLSQRGELHIRWVDRYDRLRHLHHDSLANQLRPTLANRDANIHARLLALEIAQTCNVDGLTDELLVIAFDRSANIELRVVAIDGLKELGDKAAKTRLIKLARESSEDPTNRVRSAALEVLWPEFISADELFDLISAECDVIEINRYSGFVSRRLAEQIRPDQIAAALRWVIRQKWSRFHIDVTYRDLLDGILVAAWNTMDTPGVVNLLAEAIHHRLRIDHGRLLAREAPDDDPFVADAGKRQRLLCELVPLMDASEHDALFICRGRPPIVRPEDLPWLLNQLETVETTERAKKWVEVCKYCYSVNNTDHTDLIFRRASEAPRIRDAFSWLFNVVALDSPEAQTGREERMRYNDLRATPDEKPKLDPPPPQRIQHWLNQCETSNPCIWWHLARELTLVTDEPHYGDTSDPDITTFPGWHEADEPTRSRIVNTARQYILCCNDGRDKWLSTPNTFFLPANAGYQAFRLLLTFDPSFVDALRPETWGNWATALVEYPLNLAQEEKERFLKPLLSRALQCNADAVADAIMAVLRREASGSQHLTHLHRAEEILDHRVTARLRSLAEDSTFTAACRGQVSAFLIEHLDQETVAKAMKLTDQPLPREEDDRSIAVTIIATLAGVVGTDQWDSLWRSIQDQPDLGRALVDRWAYQHDDTRVLTQLTDKQLADLYIWVSMQYPHNEDPHPRGAHTVGLREHIAHWRDQYLLQLLKQRGTFSACAALAAVQTALPDQQWLTYTVHEAITLARSKSWRPLDPKQVLQLVRNTSNRIIGSDRQLLTVIMESLQRLHAELHGTTPAIRDIWDHDKEKDTWRPIGENPLSDYITRHLRRDICNRGIVVNREVEIRPRLGTGAGERTDIHVDAAIESPGGVRDIVSVIIEAKGCWHPDVNTAMETQLVDRYLRENNCSCGLYLVGWFMCGPWDGSDYRKAATPRMTFKEAESFFVKQAAALSVGGIRIRARVLDTSLRESR